MNKTKEKILHNALSLFNSEGVADISIRQIAKNAGISHSNLIYHFKTKSEIIQSLHELLLAEAIEINQNINRENFDVLQLHLATKKGFEVVYKFRFLFYNLLYISNNDAEMQKTLIKVEKVRNKMYEEVIQLSINKGLMRKEEFPEEYENFILWIRIFSDNWLSSSAIYDNNNQPDIDQYVKLFMQHFYPYLTTVGKKSFKKQGLIE